MQKNSSSIETEQRHLCRVFHFRQKLMLTSPHNDRATSYGTYWKYPTEHYKIAWDVPKNVFLIILATAGSGMPTPDICFLPGPLRWTLLPKHRYSDSLSDRGSNTRLHTWEADALRLSYRRPSKIFVANA